MGGAAVGLVMLLLIGLLLLRRPLRGMPIAVGGPDSVQAGASRSSMIGAGESADARLEKQMIENAAEQSQIEAEALSRIKLPANTKKTEVLVKHIRESVQKDPGGAANVLRTWVSELESGRKPL
jgi:flagellar biosynthesis/type III secretory pathway M-ring protein FliF/YscJ